MSLWGGSEVQKGLGIVVERVLLGSLLHDEGCTDDFFLNAHQLDKVISHLPPKMYVYRLGLLGCGFFGSV